ncbi:MAG: C45 family autoproteolytic acyltransferase/hydrolase [Polyangiaceae bacterium]
MQASLVSESLRAVSSVPRPAYERRAGLHVLRLAGDDYEMGFQHGLLLKEALGSGPIPYFERYVESLLAAGLGPRAGRWIGRGLRHSVGRLVAQGFPAHVRRALDGLSDGAGLRRQRLLGAVTMPETYLWVIACALALRSPRLAPRSGIPLLGCTSAVAWGDATRDGGLLHGRKFDYQGVGAWDTEQAVVFHRPSDGQPYVSISAAGVLFGGITAMNAAGLSLVVHQHMVSDAMKLGGVPIGVTGDSVMRHAKNLDDARRILDADVPNGCWTYVVASGRERATLVYEVTPKGRAFRVETEGTVAYSNVFWDAELGRTERHLYPSHWRNNLARLRRTDALLSSARGQIDERTIARILGDTGSDGCRFETAISMLLTVASVVFRPADGVVWVATGRAPVANRSYVPFDLASEGVRNDLPELDGEAALAPRAGPAFDAYREAYAAYFDAGDLASARRHLARAIELQPSEALYHFVSALVALLEGDSLAAEAALDRAVAIGHVSGDRRASFHLWRGRARDVLGRRSDACADYRKARYGDEYVRAAAERGLTRRYRPRRFGVEFALADVPMP